MCLKFVVGIYTRAQSRKISTEPVGITKEDGYGEICVYHLVTLIDREI